MTTLGSDTIVPQSGLTLIEVLIALAIVGISMTAVIKTTSQSIRATNYLQNKMIATWVAQEKITEARMGLLRLSPENESREKTNALNRDWFWQAQEKETPNKRIKKIEVKVFEKETEEESPLITLESFTYKDE
jgi:general secretion pathway protein I